MTEFSRFSSTTTTVSSSFSSNNLRDRIRSANFVYLITPSCCNGTIPTAEDYCDFVHIDNRDSFGSSSSWKTSFEELATRALEVAAMTSRNIIISSTTHQTSLASRDFLVRRLIEGGASEEKITVVRLAAGGAFATDPIRSQSHGSYKTQYCTWRPKQQAAAVVAQSVGHL